MSVVSAPVSRSTSTSGPEAFPIRVRTVIAVRPSARICCSRYPPFRSLGTSESGDTTPRPASLLYQSVPSGAYAAASVVTPDAETSSGPPPSSGRRNTCRLTPWVARIDRPSGETTGLPSSTASWTGVPASASRV